MDDAAARRLMQQMQLQNMQHMPGQARNIWMDDSVDRDSSPNTSLLQPSTSNGRLKNECITEIEPIILTQRWTVNSFPTIMKLARPGACLRSNIFRDPAAPDACWQLCLYPGGKRDENANHVSLFLKMSATTPMKEVLVKAEYRFYFLDDADQPRFSNVNIGDFHAKPPKGGHSWGLRNIPKQKVANCIRSDQSLVISCVIELMPDVSRLVCKKVTNNPIAPMVEVSATHADNELALLNSGDGSDCELLTAEGVTLNAHRYKLMAHSAVFRAMFTHEHTQEHKEGRVVMDEHSERSVQLMLQFMYGGRIDSEIHPDDAIDTMIIAEKYDISALKTMCEQAIINKTEKSNVCEHIQLADFHQAHFLMQHCIEIVCQNKHAVLKSESWAALRDKSPKLLNQVLENVVSQEHSSPPLKRSRI